MPLLAARARRPAAIVAVSCLVLIVALAIPSAHQNHGAAIDRPVDSWIIGRHIPSHVLSAVSLLGGEVQMAALTAVLALACLAARGLAGAALAVVGVMVAATLTEYVLKPLVHQTLAGDLTYPSGHTTGLFALATIIAVVLLNPRSGRVRPAAWIAVVIAAVASCAVGFAVIALHYHYFIDTIGGGAVGTGAVLGTAFLLDVGVVRRWLRPPGR